MSPNNQILFKAEDAMAALISTILEKLEGCSIHLGGQSDGLKIPYIGIIADTGEERQPRGKGNWTVNGKIEIHTSADDQGRELRKRIVGHVADLLSSSTIADDLTRSISDFTCHGFLIGNPSQKVEDRTHIYSIEFVAACCGSDV